MASYVALLYSIVLPAGKRLVMADLREMAERIGLGAPRSLLATGNLLFETDETDIASLERQLEGAFDARFAKAIPIIVRTASQWADLVAGNPLPQQSVRDGSMVAVRVQRQPAARSVYETLLALKADGEALELVDGDLWFSSSTQISNSRLFSAMTPKRVGIGTWRNWNTVRRIGDALDMP